jgi:hypothetical protein
MKRIIFASAFFTLLFSLVLWSCKKSDTLDPQIEGFAIDDYDVIQLTNDNPDVPVYISYNDDRGIDSVSINVYKEGTTNLVAHNVIRNLIHSATGRTRVTTPFPYADLGGPTGVYTIEYKVTDKTGKSATTSYNVNVLNNKTRNLCDFPAATLPAGKNVWIRVTSTQPVPAGKNVYVTGSFEKDNGGAGDWTGGSVDMFKLTRLSDRCFYIALNLTNSHQFKFTLGDWNQEAQGNQGQTPSNATWNGSSVQDITVYNWKGQPLVMQTIPQVLPNQGIVSGNMSVIADVNSTDDAMKYYLVQKGGSLTDKSNPMYRVTGTTKVIGSVPKNSNLEYIVVRDNNGTVKQGVNAWGFEQSVKWDGKTNPVGINISKFKDDQGILTVPANLYIVGDAAPDNDWSNPTQNPPFTQVAPGKFEIASIALTSGKSYLLLPQNNGNWDTKFGGDGKLGGDIVPQGNNIPAPDQSGNYKITVDFTTGKYTLTKL